MQPQQQTVSSATSGSLAPHAGVAPPVPTQTFHTFADTIPIQDEQEYRMIAEAIPQIVWTARPDGYNDYFNARWFEYTGLSHEDTYNPTNQGWPDYDPTHIQEDPSARSALHPEDFATYMRRWKEALETGKSYEIEYRFRRALDGEYRWHLGRAVPIRDGNGHIIKWFGTCTDIHDQKMAQERMRTINRDLERSVLERTHELEDLRERDQANIQRLKEIIHNLPMGAIALDENDTVLHYNDRFLTIFNLKASQEELLTGKGVNLRKAIKLNSLYPDTYMQRLEEIIASHKSSMGDEIQLTDGRVIARDHMPIFDKGTYRGFLLLYRDITQEKRIDASKSEFMSLASHQLRTPLTTIRWVLGRLERRLKGHISPQDERLVQEGKNATMRMADTIDTMLGISRIEAGKVKLDIAQVQVCPLLEGLLLEFKEEGKRRHQSLTLECDPHVQLQTDEKLLREILSNLVSNAVKYTPERGTIRVTVTEDDEHAHIVVTDTGLGIPSHQQEKIFTKFFRGENVIQHDTNGTGLGLYLVYLLSRILNGDITFTSEENKGTSFTLTLPRTFSATS
jgi:PAS domain S-box-containing protein